MYHTDLKPRPHICLSGADPGSETILDVLASLLCRFFIFIIRLTLVLHSGLVTKHKTEQMFEFELLNVAILDFNQP